MRTAKIVTAGIVAAAGFALPSTSLATESLPDPACAGQVVALFNHFSGPFGASGNPNASAGPGYSLRQDTSETIHEVRDGVCP